MIRTRIFACLVALSIGFAAYAQGQESKKLLFTYGTDSVYTDEFVRVFLKNNKKEEQTDSSIQAYLNLYVNFKLRVKEAHVLGMQNDQQFLNELKGYRQQLAHTYMTDTSLTSKLTDEAYKRLQEEVKASHILILCPSNALPKDTLAAWKKITAIRKRALKGENFDTLAYHESQDPSAKSNLGNLGYFSAFNMIYPFETQAYQTGVNELSPVFRTEYGYHFLKVFDRRASRGDIKVSHLMLTLNTNPSEKEVEAARRKLDTILAQLKNGADWNQMVSTYSEEPRSAANGGKLEWISSIGSSIDGLFKEAAFTLKNEGDIIGPVRSNFGMHLIKLDAKRGIGSFEERRDWIRMQVNREPARAKMSQAVLLEKIKAENKFVESKNSQKLAMGILDSSIIKGTFNASNFAQNKTTLFSISEKKFSVSDFAQFVMTRQASMPEANLVAVKEQMYTDFVNASNLQYEEDHLDEKYPQFRYLMQEYHDGILLFNLNQEKIWMKAGQDTAGLRAFYEEHKGEHTWPERVQATLYEANSKSAYKKTKKLVKKELSDTEISETVNKENPLSLVIKHSKFVKGENSYVDQVTWKTGLHTVKTDDGKYILVHIKEVLPAGPKKLNEVRGIMIGEYQDYLEKSWIQELKAKYPVHVNDAALEGILNQ
ncbi:MAG: hypothetical protein EP332_09845 [Bacteroidetes bacterium]|nr:MAG: hypothetical protein EP332_09845 [Bacteroidota bacterium]